MALLIFAATPRCGRGRGKAGRWGRTYVSVLRGDVGQQCPQAGLLDEILVFFAPVLLGGGTRMFAPTGSNWIDLEGVSDDAVHWYRVRRS